MLTKNDGRCIDTAGVTGNILIHSSGTRLNTYDVLEYTEGRQSFYAAMIVDLTQSTDQVRATSTRRIASSSKAVVADDDTVLPVMK